MEDHILRVFEKMFLRKIFGPDGRRDRRLEKK
jgi:hypothetical protein